jgi:putative ABC transport system ATP-binding protein
MQRIVHFFDTCLSKSWTNPKLQDMISFSLTGSYHEWHGIGTNPIQYSPVNKSEKNMNEVIIHTTDLTRIFASEELETTAVNHVNLRVEKGEFVAVMGPSGCGKTTLLNMLGLIDRCTSGSYRFMGTHIENLSENRLTMLRRGNIGFIFQNYNLVEELNVEENVELPLLFSGMPGKDRRARVHELLQQLKLGHRGHHHPQQLSGGQQQRVAFARAIAGEPVLLLADEPTGNLDSKNGLMIMDLLADYNRRGGTVFMVTHSARDASFAQRIIHLHDGAIKE